jgi:hypothetical protein
MSNQDHWTKQLRQRVKDYQTIINLLTREQTQLLLKDLPAGSPSRDILLSRLRAIEEENK